MSSRVTFNTGKGQAEKTALLVKHLIERGLSFSLNFKGSGDVVVKVKKKREIE
jgi:hypothetical protein